MYVYIYSPIFQDLRSAFTPCSLSTFNFIYSLDYPTSTEMGLANWKVIVLCSSCLRWPGKCVCGSVERKRLIE